MNTDKDFEIRTELQARAAFWREANYDIGLRYLWWKRQNAYPADVRAAWCDWVDAAQKVGRMSEALASKVTL